ncbi:DUF4157 domain-containing protein [Flavobacterium sp. JAS]|uniref:eCIS core domain-containing protein n=1 Tax=Flavobacterium sp. JAS TaxID=2897329 RepID=UPI001E62CF58|nr:DUF4157 domain-containing protein [Flavobacterium sp. JAS]MCD0470426.1 DUF4157 domain-containing protein [Flavobacterium sp. JAS]
MRAFEQRKRNSPDTSSFFGPKIQKKLKTGTVGDKYEVEADNVADKVVNSKPSAGGLLQSKEEVQQKPISATISSVQAKETKEEDKSVQKKSDKEEDKKVQKKCAECENEDKVQKKDKKEEEKPVQKKGNNTESEIQDNELEGKLDNSKGGGAGLDKNTKKEMESGFGTDFSNVKIHTDASAVQMSQELGAQAFTNGNDVYFNQGKYNPGSQEGKHLLAHELTHTVQQTGAKQKSGTIQKSSIENHPEDLQAEQPENPQFRGNPPLEKANDNQMLISTGQKGQYVAELQEGLMQAGQSLPKFGADGDFGTETRNAVIGFQTDNGLNKIDGLVGPETMGTLDNVLVEKKGGKKKKTPTKKDCDIFNRFTFSSEPVHLETLKSTKSCKLFAITLTTTKNKKGNTCPTYRVEITDSTGKTVMGPMQLSVGGTVPFNFTAPKVDEFTLSISTAQTCGANAFTGKGTKHRQ